jgi:hypothetical protein
MRDIIKYLPMLKAGTSKENYPLYAQYLHIEDGFVATCNDDAYVKVDFDMPFKGNVNLFVLETILKTLPDEYGVKEGVDIVKINAKGRDYNLNNIQNNDLPFPEIPKPDIECLEIDEGLLSLMKSALSFVGNMEYASVYIDDKGLVSTNGQRLLIYEQDTKLDTPILLSKEIISSLKEGYKIGASGNTVVEFPGGYAVFTTPHYSSYPAENIRDYAAKALADTEPLLNVGEFKELLAKVNPTFFGEGKRIIDISNSNGIIEVSGKSPYNGTAKASMSSMLQEDFDMTIDADHFTAVPDDYDLHVHLGSTDRIAAKNHVAEILLRGV